MEKDQGNSSAHQRRWWRFLVLPGLQLRYSLLVFVIQGSAYLLFLGYFYSVYDRVSLAESGSPDIMHFLRHTAVFFFTGLVLYSCITTIYGMFTLHKVAGPLFHFQKSMKTVAEGNLTHRIYLRRNDQLHEVADSINSALASLQAVVREDRGVRQDLIRELETLAQQAGESNQNLAGQLRALKERLSASLSKFVI